MATDWIHVCPACTEKSWQSLFDSLHAVASGQVSTCAKCATTMDLHLSFPWGLGAGTFKCTVRDAFMPDHPAKWHDEDGREITFYPFLVITEGNGERFAWLPYWHVVRSKDREQKKYGQWAPSMDLSSFQELITKAKAKGYLETLGRDARAV